MSTAVKLFPTPDDIADLHVWFDANDANIPGNTNITKDGSNRVSQWNSKGIISIETKQSTGSKQPLWVASVEGGKAGLLFDPANSENLVTDGNIALPFSADLGATCFYIVKSNVSTIGTDGNFISQVRNGSQNGIKVYQEESTNDWGFNNRRLTAPADVSGTLDSALWQSGTTVRYQFDGTENLSSVVVDDVLRITGCINSVNDGQYEVVTINDGADWIEVLNPARTSSTGDEIAGSPAIIESYSSGNSALNSINLGDFGLDTNTHLIMTESHMDANDPDRLEGTLHLKMDDFGNVAMSSNSNQGYLNIADTEKLWIGARETNTGFFDGHILEMICYGRPLNKLEKGQIWDYVRRKYAFGW